MTPDNDSNGPGPWGSRGPRGNDPQGGKPWGQRPGGPQNDDRPDLDSMLRAAQNRFKGAFGGGKSPMGGFSPGMGFGVIIILLLGLWLGTGLYRVQPEEDAVIKTFGKWT